ncbi:MAG: anaerobic ribonucleoside triphosphate reductase [Prevotellaceae bacterium]|jgi:ribonucleoside-triphosphate reductase|nr:anaerobic ribonucleoside triphosphate reductase [Prevotellaceae bacterium]
MNHSAIQITKRDGKRETFSLEKIKNAIAKAFHANNVAISDNDLYEIALAVTRRISNPEITVEEIQDLVEKELMRCNEFIAKKYILYREARTREREARTDLKQIIDSIASIARNDINQSNANMSSHTPAGQMMTLAAESAKNYTEKFLLPHKYMQAHRDGDIHIHDLDYYFTKTTTCIQYDLDDIFERGFRTKNGSIRTPQSIQSYATLATIIFQTNQNEQHGGQSIPAFDFFMAKGIRKSFRKHLIGNMLTLASLHGENADDAKLKEAVSLVDSIEVSESVKNGLLKKLAAISVKISAQELDVLLQRARESTRKDTHQAMEGFIHNLNTMHSRGGNQVVFSSINYGTDTSPEGRMLILELLSATAKGLGRGEIPVFPIQIFKVKEGVSYSEEDCKKALADFDAALRGEMTFGAPNFDLLLESCKTTSTALFPNFLFLDAPFNINEKWNANDPKRYVHEVTSMGCRTRVFENLRGEKSSLGRGNISFTSMNMPRIAIEARRRAEEASSGGSKKEIQAEARKLFLDGVYRTSTLIADQLYERYKYQRTALAKQFPFMMANDVWKGGSALQPDDEVGDVISSGTLGIGFIGGHNAMMAIYGEGHATNEEAWQTLYEAIQQINKVVDEYKERYRLNYSVLATPAEGLSGRFTAMDKKKYGIISGVNDRDYYVNSFHIDVKEKINMAQKIKKEAPFHAITKGGHITYVELDGEAKKNMSAMLKIVQLMRQENVGYGSINHPVDRCRKCGYQGVIYAACPVCKNENISRMRRITGYLTGDLDSWNSSKRSEEADRVNHM